MRQLRAPSHWTRFAAIADSTRIRTASSCRVAAEFLNGLWHLDTKTWRTLPMVIFRPGTLTRNYVFGKRARYLSPLTMFLFAIFLMFFAFSTIQAPVEHPRQPSAGHGGTISGSAAGIGATRKQNLNERAQILIAD